MRNLSFGQDVKLSLMDRLLNRWRGGVLVRRLRTIEPKVHIADLGCGYHAPLLRYLLSLFPSVRSATGLDLAVEPLALGQGPLRTIAHDLNVPLPLPDAQFDVLVSTAVLEHLVSGEACLREAFRVLKPGGHLLLTTPSTAAQPVLEFIAYRLHLIDAEEIRDHKHYYTHDELRTLAQQVGFHEITVESFQWGFNSVLVCRK